MIDRDTARQEVREQWEPILQKITHPAQTKVNGRTSYVCPLCGHGAHGDGLTINKRSKTPGALKCFGCGFSGDIIALLQKVNNYDFNTALQTAAGELGISLSADTHDRAEAAQRPVRRKAKQVPTYRTQTVQEPTSADYSEYYKECRDRLTDARAISYLSARGISFETACNLWIGFDAESDPASAPGAIENEYRPHPTPRIIIPTSKGHYTARAIDPNTPKQYAKLNARNSTPSIFNSRALAEHDLIFVVEGCFDALSFCEVGAAAVATNSKNNGQALLDTIRNHSLSAKSFIICPDNDADPRTNADTQRQAQELCEQLRAAGHRAIVYNVAGNYHDANDALIADRAGFIQRIEAARQAVNQKPLEPNDYSDLGQAGIFCREYGDKVKFSKATGFITFNGTFWEESDLSAQALAQELTARQLSEARQRLRQAQDSLIAAREAGDEAREKMAKAETTQAKAYHSFVLKRRGSFAIKATLTESAPTLQVSVEQLDRDPFLLNTPGGTVDLRTGGTRPNRAEDFCTKVTGCSPSNENAELWKQFLNEITCGDGDLQSYLQLCAGMIAIGAVKTEKLLIAWGQGGNGKSTLFNLWGKVLGTYSGSLPSESLIVRRNQNRDFAIAELRGKRFIVAAELSEGARLSTDAVKKLCSTDSIAAEKKHKDPFSFIPSHSIVLYTNILPEVRSTDKGTWDRIAVVPFNARFRNAETEIKDYAGYLFDHAGGAVLNWIIEGAVRFIASGYKLPEPDAVRETISKYRDDSDWLQLFLLDQCEKRADYTVSASNLYARYTDYCGEVGEARRSQREFKSALEQAGHKAKHTKYGTVYCGLRLNEWQAAGGSDNPFRAAGFTA